MGLQRSGSTGSTGDTGPTGNTGPTGTHPVPNAGNAKQSGTSAGPVVPKSDHLGRARIYRKEKRPNLHHYRDDFYDYHGGHYVMVDDHTVVADLYTFLDKCRKQVTSNSQPKFVPFEPDTKSIHETINALKAVGHVLPTIEQPYWLDGHAGSDPAQLICFPNGILNLSTNEFMPPDPRLFTPNGVAFGYDPDAPEPVRMAKVSGSDFWRRARPNRRTAGDIRLFRLKRRVAGKSFSVHWAKAKR